MKVINMKKCDINILIDRSGSMEVLKSDIVDSINNFIKEQTALPGEAVFSVYQFDDEYTAKVHREEFPEPLLEQVEGKDNPKITHAQYKPRAWTGLVDAACITIDNIGKRLASLPPSYRPDGVVVVIVTDGMDNNSRQYDKVQLKQRIEHQQEKYNWKFLFLAANQDSCLTGASYGIAKGDTTDYEATSSGVHRGVRLASASTGLYRGGSN